MTPTINSLVVGASRGFGSGIVAALADAGATVTGVSRTAPVDGGSPRGNHVTADAADASVAGVLLDHYDPDLLVLVAGANPLIRPLQHQTWETFSANWNTDVKIAFHWLREVLLKPLRPGSLVVVFSSGAALAGSPLSGGYAGAKAAQRFITGYAQQEADIAGLDLRFVAVLPRITPLTSLGGPAVAAYAARQGITEEEYVRQFGEPLSPAHVGAAVVRLQQTPRDELASAYLLAAGGLQPLP